MARAKKGSARRSPERPVTRVVVQGFKSIRDRTELELRPLTLLAGRNSSGKSSMMQALLLLKQTLEAPIDPGPLKLNGENVTFSSAEQMFWKGKPRKAQAIEIGVTTKEQVVSLHFNKKAHGVGLDRLDYVSDSRSVWRSAMLREGMTHAELEALLSVRLPRYASEVFKLRVERRRCLLTVTEQFVHAGQSREATAFLFNPAAAMEELLARMIHLPGHRGNPERAYPSTQVGAFFPGVFQPYTASVIAAWKEAGDVRLGELGRQLSELELTGKVDARRLDDTRVEIQVGRLSPGMKSGSNDLVNIADVGFGVSQTLPLLTALLAAQPGQIVYVEQPETHLHPVAQVSLARCLLEAARRGVIVVAETHSHLLLKGVQIEVASGRADPELARLHWFTRSPQGSTTVSSASLDQHGTFGDWPEDFADVELDVEEKFLRASMATNPR